MSERSERYGWRKVMSGPPVLDFGKPATIGTAMEPMDPLDRKLADLTERIARLERRSVQGNADLSVALRLVGDALVNLGRMMKGEDDGTRR